MKNEDKTKEQLIEELEKAHKEISYLEHLVNESKKMEEALWISEEQSHKMAKTIKHKLKSEAIVALISSRFISGYIIDNAIDSALADIGKFINANRAYIFFFDEEKSLINNVYEWCSEGIEPQIDKLQNISTDTIPCWMSRLNREEIVYIKDVSKMPKETELEKKNLENQNIKSLLALPLYVKREVIGFIGFDSIFKIREWSNNDIELVHIISDIIGNAIERKEIEETLRTINQQLLQEISKCKKHISDLNAFAHTVAHDLKNPLTVIIGFSDLLNNTLSEKLDAEPLSFLKEILQMGYKMQYIIDELLVLASVRQEEIDLQPLNMNNIIDEVEKRLSCMIDKYQVKIIKPTSYPKVLGYASWIEEVWVNYISNAIKYGGTPPNVELGTTSQTDGFIRFWVCDNGDGISSENQIQVFDAFKRMDKSKAKGSGLGLSIVKRIIEKLGGKVSVESEGIKGKGSTFSFTLPTNSVKS